MAFVLITLRQTDGDKMEIVADFLFLGSKITADSDCSHEIKRPAPWKESYDKSGHHIKKQSHHFSYKGPSSQSNVFFRSLCTEVRVGP